MSRRQQAIGGEGGQAHSLGWKHWPDDQLLALRLCDLRLRLPGSWVMGCIQRLFHELKERGIRFRPHFWVSSEWFTPEGIPGIAVPFYLLHPRLIRLERGQMHEVEGGTLEWCMKILRHETGHAIENAYRLRRRHERQRLFGKSTSKYPQYYSPSRSSRGYVQHLDAWYAQSHPDEDFAETFAVWLGSERWKRRYADWPALEKLRYVDRLMEEIAPTTAPNRSRLEIDPLPKLRQTLRAHYRAKRRRYGYEQRMDFDEDLLSTFSIDARFHKNMTAATFLRRMNNEVTKKVSRLTGETPYTLSNVLKDMTRRAHELNLRVRVSESETTRRMTSLLSTQTRSFFEGGNYHFSV